MKSQVKGYGGVTEPYKLGGPHVLPERAAEQLGVPAKAQALGLQKRLGLLEDRRRPGDRLVLRNLPGHLLAAIRSKNPCTSESRRNGSSNRLKAFSTCSRSWSVASDRLCSEAEASETRAASAS